MPQNQELNERLEAISKSDGFEKLEMYYNSLKNTIKLITNSPLFNLAIIQGINGIGKTYQIKKKLEDMNEEYVVKEGRITTLQLYNFVWANKDLTIILDDVPRILDNPIRRGLVMSMCDTDNKKVSYTTSRDIEAEEEFEFGGSLIVVLNDLENLGADKEALLTRGYYLNLDFTYEEIMEIIFELSKKDLRLGMNKKERLEVARWLRDNTSKLTKNLNIRTFQKALDTSKILKDWKKYVKEEVLKENEMLSLCYDIVKGNRGRKKQVEKFKEETGMSRRTFYRKIKELKEIGVVTKE